MGARGEVGPGGGGRATNPAQRLSMETWVVHVCTEYTDIHRLTDSLACRGLSNGRGSKPEPMWKQGDSVGQGAWVYSR